jgi:hypothetical protein
MLYASVGHAQGGITAAELAPLVGSWTLDAARSGQADPERRVLSMGPGWMRVEIQRPTDDRPISLMYNLDGTKNVSPYGAGTATTEMRRENNDIVTVTIVTINNSPVTVVERLAVTPEDVMTAAVTLRVEHGYQGVQPALQTRPSNVAETLKHFRRVP